MPGAIVTTDASTQPKTLREWVQLGTTDDPKDYPATTTLRRDPSDTSGATITVGPDKDGCIIPLQAGEWYWERNIDPGSVAIQGDGTKGVKIFVVWGGPEWR